LTRKYVLKDPSKASLRAKNGKMVKGHSISSGRPKGAINKITAELRAAAQEYTTEALNTIAKCMRQTKDLDISLRAAAMILDRGYGKPAQAHNIGGPNGEALDFSKMSMQEIDAIIIRMESAITGPVGDGTPRIESGEETTH
jgi:hypothetical protein